MTTYTDAQLRTGPGLADGAGQGTRETRAGSEARGHEHGHDTEGHHAHGAGGHKTLGMWLYLMSDCVLFGTLFASFAVLSGAFAGGPTGAQLVSLPYVLTETFVLLASSITYGYAMVALQRHDKPAVLGCLALTFALGLVFIGMEVHEFAHLIAEGAGPTRSGYWSSFFALVGTHGLHVSAGLVWMAVVMHQVYRRGLSSVNETRLACLSLFWHFLDLVWVCVFTFVYLSGAV